MVDANTLLTNNWGSVVAPAGCGKTELIALAAKTKQQRPLLVLTHTHAGVRALRDRLKRQGVQPGAARIETIAGWALRFAVAFPKGANLADDDPVEKSWDAVYEGVVTLLGIRAVREVVQASYGRVLVDEYQDCTKIQHALLSKLADHVPTCILGDPLQGIFSFAGGQLAWTEVQSRFPALGELTEPWRWRGKNEPLGQWCLTIRRALIDGTPIDLSRAPITWAPSDNANQISHAHRAASLDGTVVAIRKWEHQAHGYAKNLGGRYRSMEEIEGKSLRTFADEMDKLDGPARAMRIIELAKDCMTGVSAAIPTAVKALEAGKRPESKRTKNNPDVCEALARVYDDPSTAHVQAAIERLGTLSGCRIYRKELWRDAKELFHEFGRGQRATLRETARAIRDRHRAIGRGVDPRLVSRTLLIKGLEFDHALVPAASEFIDTKRPEDGARHFYVAVTRGSRTLTVLSESRIVKFSPASV